MNLKQSYHSLKEKVSKFVDSWYGRLILKTGKILFLVLILAYLAFKLYQIGWQEVVANLPVNPLFYLFFILLYFSAPLVQIIIYRLTWKFDVRRNLFVFVKKRILNKSVLGYSGEVYLFNWARKTIDGELTKLGEVIRDYNILSAAASNTVTLLVLGVFLYVGQAQITDLIGQPDPIYFIIGGFIFLILIPLVYRFRKYIFSTPLKRSLQVYGIHFGRMTIGQVLQIAMWAVVLPEVSLSTWITYAAVAILVSRIPISNKKLLFVGFGVEISTMLGVPEAAMFGLLASIAALEKIFDFGLYLFFTLLQPEGETVADTVPAKTGMVGTEAEA